MVRQVRYCWQATLQRWKEKKGFTMNRSLHRRRLRAALHGGENSGERVRQAMQQAVFNATIQHQWRPAGEVRWRRR